MTMYRSADEIEADGFATPSPFRFSGYLDALHRHRKFILWSCTAAFLLSLAASLILRNNYTSTTVIIPPKQEQSVGSLLGGQGAASSLLAGGGMSAVGMNFKNPNEVYVSLLSSRTLTERIVDQFHLQQYYGISTMSRTIKALLKHTTAEIGKDGLITLSITTHDPQLSSQIANAFVDQLHNMNTGLALTDTAQRRMFFQEQLDQEKSQLASAETALEQTQSKTGILQPVGQADLLTRNISALQAQITQRQAALQSLGTYYTSENPQYKQLQAEISSLTARLATLESSQQAPSPGDVNVPVSQLPKASLEYLRRYREMQLQEQIYAMLQKQFEAAKIDEAKTAPIIQVVDRAVPADHAAGPYRSLIVLGGTIAALILNLIWWGLVYMFDTMRSVAPDVAPLDSSTIAS